MSEVKAFTNLRMQDREGRDSLNPIAVIREDHERQIRLCDTLTDMAETLAEGNQPALVLSALSLFREELPRHIKDEEEGLFPLLEKRLSGDRQFTAMLKQLRNEHEFDEDLADFILEDLAILEKGHTIPNPQRLYNNLRAFAEALRRHTAWEETTVLTIAEEQLSDTDLDQLRREMVERRLNPA
ncbi:hemerythrin domain-containing protein [Aestuariispira ectoiniformans]|uniref:hemerythrin domain-containing protein n=1 Tax=Aestuariispira ectoiniformans TaxID=2775080 RepID=UPI00223BAA80|nr:hemerythrin domain-containing protein [Aestuariispira ectoiniformans]